MQYWQLLLILISGFIGWITNWIAIKMLFHPRKPITILGLTIQGIFPKNQSQFAQKLGKLVSGEFLSFQDIEQKISKPENLQKIMPLIETQIDRFLKERLSEQLPMISMFVGDKTIARLKTTFLQEIETMLPPVMRSYAGQLKTELDLEAIITEKVATFSSDKLEELLYQIMAKEFRFVEWVGAVIGILIGIIQVLISSWAN
ncbi:MAG: DUF445 family protein [Chitinophagales bacterium]|jgi:uncharacterized membrane protein YheB (UPF0754 family)|nr:DUF445 family protein [Chitinophagales bacterium]